MHRDNAEAWRDTKVVEHCVRREPQELEQWSLVGLNGAYSMPHVDHGGLATWVRIDNGLKAWGIFDQPVDHGLLAADPEAFIRAHPLQPIGLSAGNIL